ncbi:MAG: hypothetical protein AABW64_04770 [Nanoarchaeota archaeon]
MKQKNILNDQGKPCPDCGNKLHVGQERHTDGLFKVEYCKECGFKQESSW